MTTEKNDDNNKNIHIPILMCNVCGHERHPRKNKISKCSRCQSPPITQKIRE